MKDVYVYTNSSVGKLYLHYDMPSQQYLVQLQEVGACVFKENMAKKLIEGMEEPNAWLLEECTARVSMMTEAEKREFLKSLEVLPGYTKTG